MSAPVTAFVNGAFRESASPEALDARNPTDPSDLVARVPAGCAADVKAAVEAAARAWPAWRDLAGPARADALFRWAAAVDARREALGDTTGVDPHAPFGGVKGSSSGAREQGPAAREFYTELRTVLVTP